VRRQERSENHAHEQNEDNHDSDNAGWRRQHDADGAFDFLIAKLPVFFHFLLAEGTASVGSNPVMGDSFGIQSECDARIQISVEQVYHKVHQAVKERNHQHHTHDRRLVGFQYGGKGEIAQAGP
jgi:hypothetical protein